jgi:hypothetical protein
MAMPVANSTLHRHRSPSTDEADPIASEVEPTPPEEVVAAPVERLAER